MPVTILNEQVYYEHGGNPFKGLHRWYSRKPLSFSRASVLGSLLPDSVTMEEFLYLLGVYELQDLAFFGDGEQRKKSEVRLYKTPPGSERIRRVHELCEGVWGEGVPVVLDGFAGGGSIPFEAARYGLRVFGSDLNPVAVVTMKAAMEFPLRFGPDLQKDIDKWVKWVGDEAEERLGEFFPGGEGEVVQNYLWAHTVVCPNCESTVPLSPNWWLYKRPEKQNLKKWCAVKPVPNLEGKRVDFELIKGTKGKGTTIHTEAGDFDPNDYSTIGRGVGKCPNCGNIIENDLIMMTAQNTGLGYQLYAVAYKQGKSNLIFRLPTQEDIDGFNKSQKIVEQYLEQPNKSNLIPSELVPEGKDLDEQIRIFCPTWKDMFNPRQLLTLVTYVEIINEAKVKIQEECQAEKEEKIPPLLDDFEAVAELEDYYQKKFEAIVTYLALILARCADKCSRLSRINPGLGTTEEASSQHSLNLMWNYAEPCGMSYLWQSCSYGSIKYSKLCELFGTKPHSNGIPGIEKHDPKTIQIDSASADSLFYIEDQSVDAIITDPPYYGTIQYAELSDFFYVWQKRTLGDIFPDLFINELTDKDREAVANPSRFRNMGISPDELANQDYEAKMQMAFQEYYRVLRDHGVMTVQFNHKESGAWDTLTTSLINAGFEITASWAVNTENPQNLHQAKKNSVSSTVLLICRKRDPNAGPAWWDDLRPQLANLVEQRAPEFEANNITGINLYLSAFGPALNIFSRQYPILNSNGQEVRPQEAFAQARIAIANYRFRKLVQTETTGFDPLTQWYLLAWDAFNAREFPFDEARQLALAIGGLNITELAKTHKLIDSTSGTCKLLTPQQRLKKRAFTLNDKEFNTNTTHLIDGLHAILALYTEEQTLPPVRRFLKNTNLITNPLFMKTLEIAFKVLPPNTPEHETLLNLWLNIDELKAQVIFEQLQINNPPEGQLNLFNQP